MLSRSRALALSTTVLFGSLAAADETATTTVKALTAAPLRYANQPVTVTGRFRGRPPTSGGEGVKRPRTRSRWDFVLEMDDATVWVSGIRPVGWDFDLDPRSAEDAVRGLWLEVTGIVRVDRGLSPQCGSSWQQIWIEASDLRRAAAALQPAPLVRPAVTAPALVFNDPVQGEAEVPRETAVRLQFSRPLLPETLSEHIRVSYAAPQPLDAPLIPRFTARYAEDTRSITLSFVEPLAALSAVRVELLQGILGANGLAVAPAAYTFTTGR
jgi:hypothetical protein